MVYVWSHGLGVYVACANAGDACLLRIFLRILVSAGCMFAYKY